MINGFVQGQLYELGRAVAITWIFAGIVSGVLLLAMSRMLEYLEEIAYNTGHSRKESTEETYKLQKAYPITGKATSSKLETLSKSHIFQSND